MDPEQHLRRMLRATGADLWSLIDAAIGVAARDHAVELRARRGAIVERLYAAPPLDRCGNCGQEDGGGEDKELSRPRWAADLPEPMDREEEEAEAVEEEEEDEEEGGGARAINAEQSKILAIKDFLDDPDQSEDSLVSLLQNLVDMDITYKSLKQTDIGRHVNGLRKHPSGEVRRLVKQLVRKWKETVDEWMKADNSTGDATSPAIITDGDSPQQIPARSGHKGHQIPGLVYSPNPHSGSSSERIDGSELVAPKGKATPRAEPAVPTRPNHRSTPPPPAAKIIKEHKHSLYDPDKLDSARRRLHENYLEAENAKRQRTIQVMDINEIPKPGKNAFIRKGGAQSRHR